MPKYSEEQFNNWRKPPSDTESSKLENAERMIREAIWNDPVLNKLSIEIYGQGSYANDTNVKLNSDIDINVRLSSTIFYELPPNRKKEEFGYIDSPYTFYQYKNDIHTALVKYFAEENVKRKNKCIEIKGNTYRVQADVVPTFKLNHHFENSSIRVGSKFICDLGQEHQNYGLQHIEEGKKKNAATGKKFKRTTRIFKNIRYKMIEDGILVNPKITSFLIESSIWNVPNEVFNNNVTWLETVRQCIIYLYNHLEDESLVKDWTEVSKCLYLFPGRKWSIADLKQFLFDMWNYLEFK